LLPVVSPLLLFLAVRRGLLLLVFGRVLEERLLLEADVASFIPQFSLQLAELVGFVQLASLQLTGLAAATFV